jgi:hypothetical protein
MPTKINPFPKAGEVCPNCKGRWERRDMWPMKLVALPLRTIRYRHVISFCPFCDGDVMPNYKVTNDSDVTRRD